MKYIRLLSRIILGLVFIFSGFVKAVDPLGSAYKFTDYFTAFKLDFLEFLALPIGVLLSAFELILGITLILGYRKKIIFTVTMWFMVLFTVLTFVLALFNPVSDCGCFGDALILTNWETFFKNVVLMVFVLILWFARNKESDGGPVIGEWVVIGGLYVMVSFFSFWNYRHLPLLDFRPYDVGTVISENMVIPEGMPVDEYKTSLIYKSKETGKSTSFTMDNYPKDTLLWEFETSESKLIKKGYEPPIHDFAVMDEYGNDQVEEILSDRGYSLIMISNDLPDANEEALKAARDWSQLEILANDFSFYALTSTTSSEVETISAELELGYGFFAADEIMLKTIVRSNPGFLLLKNGAIMGKWGWRDFPSVEALLPEWPELIGNASAPMDEEAQLLMEAGVYEDFSFDVMEFDQFIPDLILKEGAIKQERGVIIAFILGVLLLMLLSEYLLFLNKKH
ncbi:MAG: DoxX family protein [Bacteroidales bacterium]|nr:DoxX family protein [Bacteroidales bacterium]